VRFRRSFATLGGGVAIRVVPELTEHPGAEDDTKSWQGAVDVGVRVCLTRKSDGEWAGRRQPGGAG
jgi:hypothetical protein